MEELPPPALALRDELEAALRLEARLENGEGVDEAFAALYRDCGSSTQLPRYERRAFAALTALATTQIREAGDVKQRLTRLTVAVAQLTSEIQAVGGQVSRMSEVLVPEPPQD